MADGGFSSARALIRWAREDIEELNAAAERFVASNPYSAFTEFDPETGHVFAKIRMSDVPEELCKFASHALWDIKHALDHATCAAVRAIKGGDIGDIHFPVASHPNDLEAKLRHIPKGQTSPKYPVALHDTFRKLQPYPTSDKYSGGGDDFVALSKLANTTKHTVSLGTTARPVFSAARGTGGLIAFYLGRWDSAKKELTIGLFQVGAELNVDFQLTCIVSISDSEAWQNHTASDVLNAYAVCVESIIDDLEAAVS